MREIEYRGLRINGNGWAYGYYIYKAGIGHQIYDITLGAFVLIDIKTLGQYTGLPDKNGVKVFEGDIVKSERWKMFLRHYKRDDDTILIKVEWFKTKWVGCIIGEVSGTYDLGDFVSDGDGDVIGNIYEHSHLLEDSK